MAGSKKYAGLPDLDPAPEIYETPELTDDASTVQTNTLPTESPTPSEDGQIEDNVDRTHLNTEAARRRFEPMVVNTKDTNLSDAIGGARKGYRTTHRRRRRYGRDDTTREYEDQSGESSEEEETLSKKLARLRRETEEIRLELAKREQAGEEDEFKDSLEHHEGGHGEDNRDVAEGVEELGEILSSLKTKTRKSQGETVEQHFSRQLDADITAKVKGQTNGKTPKDEGPITASNSISAITAFADRLTALEKALGVPPMTTTTSTMPVISTLNTLSSQISILSNSITSPPPATDSLPPYLETISERLKLLQSESETLLSTRRAALQTLAALHDARQRGTSNSSVFAKYLNRREAQLRTRDNLPTTITDGGDDDNKQTPNPQSKDTNPNNAEDRVFSDIFLDEQSSKITALYNTLPTIQKLQPLLPVVLERLRGLSIIHASAATAQNDMEDLENRLKGWEVGMQKWRSAVEGVERGIEESKVVMKENVEVIGGMVKGVERRLDGLREGGK